MFRFYLFFLSSDRGPGKSCKIACVYSIIFVVVLLFVLAVSFWLSNLWERSSWSDKKKRKKTAAATKEFFFCVLCVCVSPSPSFVWVCIHICVCKRVAFDSVQHILLQRSSFSIDRQNRHLNNCWYIEICPKDFHSNFRIDNNAVNSMWFANWLRNTFRSVLVGWRMHPGASESTWARSTL